jgi:hypothetical protein
MFDSDQKGVCFGCSRLGKNKNRDYCARKCKKRKDYLKSLHHSEDQAPGWIVDGPTRYLDNADGRSRRIIRWHRLYEGAKREDG